MDTMADQQTTNQTTSATVRRPRQGEETYQRIIASTDRLITLFRSATDAELAYGLTWYADRKAEVDELASEYQLAPTSVAGIIAAMSPRTPWPQNMNKARQLLATGETYGLRHGVNQAKAILAGADPDEVLTGNKVRSFWTNLADLGGDAVTVDAHAYDAYVGYVTNDRERKRLDRRNGYQTVADAYRSAARVLGVAPHVAQAVIWAVWRNRYGRFAYQRLETT